MTLPWVQKATADMPSCSTAFDLSMPVFVAPYAATITSVQYVPAQSITAPILANSRVFTLYNRGSGAGTGTAVVAQLALTTSGSVGVTDNVPATITLSATTSLLSVESGDVLEWESLHRTTGVPDPGGQVVITYSRS